MNFQAQNKTIQYCPTPKCGCTSTKIMIYKALGGTISDEEDIHLRFPTPTFTRRAAHIKFCIIRDPVERFLSAYSNKVVHHGIIPFVEFDDFIDNFQKYYNGHKGINHHFRPQVVFIGRFPNYHNRILSLSQMPSVSEFLSEIIGKPVKLEKRQTGGNNRKPVPTKKQIDFIESLYKDDYRFFKEME